MRGIQAEFKTLRKLVRARKFKTCRLTNYVGSNDEFQFARNIMQNASNLQTMTICTNTSSNEAEKRKMIEIISLCTRDSATCKLSFE